jgi:hypothetical protein
MERISDTKYLYKLSSLLKKHYTKPNIKFKTSKETFNIESKFISPNIMTSISEYNKVYECDLPDIRCIIFTKKLTPKLKSDIQLIINRFCTMLKFLKYHKISFNTDKFTFIYISTDHKKIFPNQNKILGSNEVNSGMSYIYKNKIYIWREEEFLKVFLHELFHCLGFDRFLIEDKCELKKYFNINNHLACNEGYNELCAIIYHCCFLSIENNKYNVVDLIEKNRVFTLYQIKQILQYYNLRTLNNTDLFQQNTGIFSYFILKGFYLFHMNELIELTKIDTFYFFPINHFKRFKFYEKACLNNKSFYKVINKLIETFKYKSNNTLRMTIN